MEIKHNLSWESAFNDCLNDIFGGVITQFQKIRIGNGVFFGGFVADVVQVAIPTATGVGDVIELIEVDVETGLGEDGE
jgi:hypothetical protein